MRTHAKKYFKRKNTISWSEAGQLQMDQSPALYYCRPPYRRIWITYSPPYQYIFKSLPFPPPLPGPFKLEPPLGKSLGMKLDKANIRNLL